MLPVSNDTLLRVVRRRGAPCFAPPSVVGIDDWAWRRNQRYGTIICDLERRNATLSGAKRSRCCPTENRRPRMPGCQSSHKSRSSRVIVAGRMP